VSWFCVYLHLYRPIGYTFYSIVGATSPPIYLWNGSLEYLLFYLNLSHVMHDSTLSLSMSDASSGLCLLPVPAGRELRRNSPPYRYEQRRKEPRCTRMLLHRLRCTFSGKAFEVVSYPPVPMMTSPSQMYVMSNRLGSRDVAVRSGSDHVEKCNTVPYLPQYNRR
jgi:hypothetical protein